MGGIAFELVVGEGAEADAPRAARAVTTMLRSMRHRGRDGARLAGLAAPGMAAALGFAATWFLDEDEGSEQPRIDGDLVVAFDGRLDGRAALARELGVALDAPDAAIALAALRRWGEAALKRLPGDRALVAIDLDPLARRAPARIVAAPDRLGGVPLYYRWCRRDAWQLDAITRPTRVARLRVASEKQALFADEPAPPVAFDQLSLAIAEEYTERDATLYTSIRAIPPGHALVVDAGVARVEPYWQLDPTRRHAITEPREASAWLRSELEQVIRDQQRGRRGIASTVSGGLDSTTIAALATDLARKDGTPPPLLVTVRYPEPEADETRESTAFAAHLGLPLHVHDTPRGPGAYPVVPSSTFSIEAMWDPYSTLLERMLETARAHGRRSISLGFGGDEIQRVTNYELAQSLAEGDPIAALRWTGPLTKRWALRRLATTSLRHLTGRRRPVALPDPPAFLTPGARAAVESERARKVAGLDAMFGDARPATRVLFETFADGDAAPFALGQGAHAAARLGTSFLQPYLDVRIVELLLGLPLGVRPDVFSRKPLTRRIAKDVSPQEVAMRTERAMFMPFYQRVLGDAADALSRLLASERLAALGVVEPGSAIERLTAGIGDSAKVRAPLSLVTYEAWLAALEAARPEPTSGPGTDAETRSAMNGSVRVGIVW